MEFTTHLELQSQTTRLVAKSHASRTDGSLTLYAAPFQGTSRPQMDKMAADHNSTQVTIHTWAIGASLAVTGPILVSFFSSA
jgi:hypothetical protein